MAVISPLQLQDDGMDVSPRAGRSIQASASGTRTVLTLELESTPFAAPDDSGGYPDGGLQAWLVVLGAWCAMVPTMGLFNTFGVLQAWIAQHELADYSESTIGWIFSIHAFVVYFFGAQVGAYQVSTAFY